MKGIILAGGSGTRLFPITKVTSKQLLPIYDKPMIYYPLSVLMLGGIREILIISTPNDLESYRKLLGDGSNIGLKLSYALQEKPEGIAQAFVIGRDFIGHDSVCLILGDNIFYGQGFSDQLVSAIKNTQANYATIFGYYVADPKEFGVVVFDSDYNVVELEEKPLQPKSNYAIPGLYFYPNDCTKLVQTISKSKRNEYEITSLNNEYLKLKRLKVELIGRGLAWLDTGTFEGLLDAGNFVRTIEKIQGLSIACLEEIAYKQGFIDKAQLLKNIENYGNTPYGLYLKKIFEEKI